MIRLTSLKSAIRSVRQACLNLNQSHQVETSSLDEARFESLIHQAYMAIGGATGEALLLAFGPDSPYDGQHFQWFRARFKGFIYIDRIIIDPDCRGHGLARQLYGQLIETARAEGFQSLVCEVNIKPMNQASIDFHEKMGFDPLAENIISDNKSVRYYQYLI